MEWRYNSRKKTGDGSVCWTGHALGVETGRLRLWSPSCCCCSWWCRSRCWHGQKNDGVVHAWCTHQTRVIFKATDVWCIRSAWSIINVQSASGHLFCNWIHGNGCQWRSLLRISQLDDNSVSSKESNHYVGREWFVMSSDPNSQEPPVSTSLEGSIYDRCKSHVWHFKASVGNQDLHGAAGPISGSRSHTMAMTSPEAGPFTRWSFFAEALATESCVELLGDAGPSRWNLWPSHKMVEFWTYISIYL